MVINASAVPGQSPAIALNVDSLAFIEGENLFARDVESSLSIR
jgi:hypothetical protein